MRIYAACGFQDISGQRIKIVLRQLHQLEWAPSRTATLAHADRALMNGPQPIAVTPAQTEIDQLFGES